MNDGCTPCRDVRPSSGGENISLHRLCIKSDDDNAADGGHGGKRQKRQNRNSDWKAHCCLIRHAITSGLLDLLDTLVSLACSCMGHTYQKLISRRAVPACLTRIHTKLATYFHLSHTYTRTPTFTRTHPLYWACSEAPGSTCICPLCWLCACAKTPRTRIPVTWDCPLVSK